MNQKTSLDIAGLRYCSNFNQSFVDFSTKSGILSIVKDYIDLYF